MRAGLIFSLARKFARSRSLALSTVMSFATAAVLVAMFITMKAFTLSGAQVVERDLGRYSARLDLSTVSSLAPEDTRLPEAVLAAARSAGARDATVALTSFDVRPDMVRPPIVLYVETNWSSEPFPGRYALAEGRWPTRPGEVVLTQPLREVVGGADAVSTLSGNERFRVAGTAIDRFESFARILAAPGTWRSFGEATRRNFSTVLATPTLYFSGEAGPVVAAVGSALARDGLATDVSPDEIGSQLAAGLRTRPMELAEQRRSWIERIPLAYQIPSLALPPLSVLAIFGMNSRRFRGNARVLTSIGMRRSTATAGFALAPVRGSWCRPLPAALPGWVSD